MSAIANSLQHNRGRNVRVAVSGLALNSPLNGTGRYARRVIEVLARFEDLQLLVVTDGRQEAWHVPPEECAAPRFVQAPKPIIPVGHYGNKLYWEQLGLPMAAWRLGVDVLFSPHFSLPLFSPAPSVVSIHDLIPLTEPGYAESVGVKAYFSLVSAAARRAKAILTLSQYSKSEIERLLHIQPDRIHVVAPGAEAAFSSLPDPEARSRIQRRLHLPEPYLLYVGGAHRRKNIGILLQAMAALRSIPGLPTLVIAASSAGAGSGIVPDWRAQAAALGMNDRIHFVERIEEEDLPQVYRDAVAFCFPSRAEGFGLTPLEAMACGAPVLSANTTSLPEAIGDAGLLLPPDDVAAWAQAMTRISTDEALRKRLSAAGKARAAIFTWDKTGSEIHNVLTKVAPCGS